MATKLTAPSGIPVTAHGPTGIKVPRDLDERDRAQFEKFNRDHEVRLEIRKMSAALSKSAYCDLQHDRIIPRTPGKYRPTKD